MKEDITDLISTSINELKNASQKEDIIAESKIINTIISLCEAYKKHYLTVLILFNSRKKSE